MAKVKGIFDSMLSSKLEDVVFVQYREGPYVRRALRLKSDKKTPDQEANQKRFASVVPPSQ
jgi:hypothetical protein